MVNAHYEKYKDWKFRGTPEAVNVGSYDVGKKLYPEQQKYLMMANIMMESGGRQMYDDWVRSGKTDDAFIDWWVTHHWKGAKLEVEDKKRWAQKELKKYKKGDNNGKTKTNTKASEYGAK